MDDIKVYQSQGDATKAATLYFESIGKSSYKYQIYMIPKGSGAKKHRQYYYALLDKDGEPLPV